MPTKKNIISFLADDELLKRIDDYRRSQDSIPSRSETVRLFVEEGLNGLNSKKNKSKAIRRLIEEGLKASDSSKSKPPKKN